MSIKEKRWRRSSLIPALFLVLVAIFMLWLGLTGLKSDYDLLGSMEGITDREGPNIAVLFARETVTGSITATVAISDASGAALTLLALDDRALSTTVTATITTTTVTTRIDTAALPDGKHTLIAEAEDDSPRQNRTTTYASFESHNQPPSLTVKLDPPSIGQGGLGSVFVSASEPVSLTATLDGQPLPFLREGNGYWTVLGFGVERRVGPRQLHLVAVDALGNRSEKIVAATVSAVSYPTESLEIPDDRLPLLAPSIVQEEFDHLAGIYGRYTMEKMWSGPFISPTTAPISSDFGQRRSYNGGPLGSPHGGLDLDSYEGDPILAANGGRVVLAEPLNVRGNAVVVDHGLGIYTGYFHMSKIGVQEGQPVAKGDVLGWVGNTGLSTGAHLHWEARVGGDAVLPTQLVERSLP